jgi:hypothetical protein
MSNEEKASSPHFEVCSDVVFHPSNYWKDSFSNVAQLKNEMEVLANALMTRIINKLDESPPMSITTRHIRVYCGGSMSQQLESFQSAMSTLHPLFQRNFIILEYLSLPEIRQEHPEWEAIDVVKWLKCSDIHFLICHLHQGNQQSWDPIDVCSAISELSDHLGFPSGQYTACPILCQDKNIYLKAVPEITNPTLRIPLNSFCPAEDNKCKQRPTQEQETKSLPKILCKKKRRRIDSKAKPPEVNIQDAYDIVIQVFTHVVETEENGWVLKLPFQTNQIVKFPKNNREIFHAMSRYHSRPEYCMMPYALLQPCMSNRKEYKVVCVNGKACSVNFVTNSLGRAFSSAPHADICNFAEYAVHLLGIRCPAAIIDGIVRVDIFLNKKNKYIVNEFESLEAVTYPGGRAKSDAVGAVLTEFNTQYWCLKVLNILSEIVGSNV